MSTLTGWEPKRLTELADYINGYAFKPEDWGKEGLPIIRIEQLKNPDAPADYFNGKLPSSKVIENGDLIFSWSASLFLRIWQHQRAALNQHLFKVIERDGVSRQFLKAFIEFYLPALTAASHGSTMQHITRKELERFGAPFPESKSEQSKIAEILSTVDRAIEQTEEALSKQQLLKTGLLHDLFTRGIDERGNLRSLLTHEFKDSALGRIPKEWEPEEFDRRIESSAFGPRFPATAYSESGNIAMLRTTDLDEFGNIAYEQMPRADLDMKAFQPHFLKQGDLLISRSGTIGVPAIFDSFEVPVIPGAFLIRFRLKREAAVPEYWRAYFNWAPGRHRLVCQAEGGVQKNLRGSSVHNMLMTFPRVAEQERAVSILNSFDSQVEAMQQCLSKLRSTKKALMQDLLTGKKRVTPLLESKPKHENAYARS